MYVFLVSCSALNDFRVSGPTVFLVLIVRVICFFLGFMGDDELEHVSGVFQCFPFSLSCIVLNGLHVSRFFWICI